MSFTEISACRCCGNRALAPILSLGMQFLTGTFPRSPHEPLTSGPLELVKCHGDAACGLVQLRHTYDSAELYGTNYGYRSSLNASMVNHLRSTATRLVRRFPCPDGSLVLDIGSNDGTLLSFMPPELARVGMDPTIVKYAGRYDPTIDAIPALFSARDFRARYGARRAATITSIAMFYDLEDPLAFVRDVAAVLAPDGVWLLEQSYLPAMLEHNAYDTVCHEHLEYYGLSQVMWVMAQCGLRVIDAEVNDVNGGSFAVTVCHAEAIHRPNQGAIEALLSLERERRLDELAPYEAFAARVAQHRDDLRATLGALRRDGASVLGYGASTKGNVILQYCGLSSREIPAMAEVNEDKFGAFTPGTGIPIISEREAHARRPDYLLVMPWHFRENLVRREAAYLERGGRMIFPLPSITVVGS